MDGFGLRTAGEKATADGEDGWNGSRAAGVKATAAGELKMYLL